MVFTKISLSLICLTSLALVHFCHAQNSPQDYLNAHNAARRQVGVRPLTWSTNLASYAQNYVNSRRGDCKLMNSGGRYGENLAMGSGSFTGAYAVSMWMNEKRYYNYNSNKCVGGHCGYYTQVVWGDSIYLGCARARCNNGYWYVSCNYSPAGNVPGERPY